MTVRRTSRKPSKLLRPAGWSPEDQVRVEARTTGAIALLREIEAKRLDPQDLTTDQRRACLMVLSNGTQTYAELAHLFGVPVHTVTNDMRHIRKTVGTEVQSWGPSEVVGQLVMAAEKFTARALKQEDTALAWTIQRDLAKSLREWGVGQDRERPDATRVTIETVGQGYQRARLILEQAQDPRLTGEVQEIDVLDRGGSAPPVLDVSPSTSTPALPDHGGSAPPVPLRAMASKTGAPPPRSKPRSPSTEGIPQPEGEG